MEESEFECLHDLGLLDIIVRQSTTFTPSTDWPNDFQQKRDYSRCNTICDGGERFIDEFETLPHCDRNSTIIDNGQWMHMATISDTQWQTIDC